MKKEEFIFPVECSNCRTRFDFADMLTPADFGKHIAELVLEKCGGDNLLCLNCLENPGNLFDEGTFKWKSVKSGDSMLPELELQSRFNKKRSLIVKKVGKKTITFKLRD